MLRVVILLLITAYPAFAKGEKPGQFDFYLLSLSWSPSWCEVEGDRKKSDQCHPRHDYGFIMHGLWPQNERGWPSFCPTGFSTPSRAMTNSMVDIMGSSGLAWHQWRKHGVCSGLSPVEYFDLSRRAYEVVKRPEVFRNLDNITSSEEPFLNVPLEVLEDAFLEANPELKADQILVTCKHGFVQEVRICMTKELEFRSCRLGDIEKNDPCGPKPYKMAPIR